MGHLDVDGFAFGVFSIGFDAMGLTLKLMLGAGESDAVVMKSNGF